MTPINIDNHPKHPPRIVTTNTIIRALHPYEPEAQRAILADVARDLGLKQMAIEGDWDFMRDEKLFTKAKEK